MLGEIRMIKREKEEMEEHDGGMREVVGSKKNVDERVRE